MTESTGAPRVAKYFSLEQGQALVDGWRQSGLSRSAFARERQVGVHVLQYWSQKLSAARVSTLTTQPSTAAFMQVRLPTAPPSLASRIEIQLPGGAVVRVVSGVDVGFLRVVLQALVPSSC
jgi:hypothetical protein